MERTGNGIRENVDHARLDEFFNCNQAQNRHHLERSITSRLAIMTIPALDRYLHGVGESLGLHPDLLKIAACLTLSYPFSAILKRLPDNNAKLKDVYCIG